MKRNYFDWEQRLVIVGVLILYIVIFLKYDEDKPPKATAPEESQRTEGTGYSSVPNILRIPIMPGNF